jgi:LysR family transcriptional regulator of abg operon
LAHPKLSFGQLMALVAAADNGGIRAASRKLGISQAAITRSLRELEQLVGLPLIQRGSRGVSLTPHGDVVYRRASIMARQMARLSDEVAAIRGAEMATVAFNVPVSLAMTILPSVIEKLKTLISGTRFSIGEGDINSALPLLRNGELDFIVTLMNGNDISSEFVVMPLIRCDSRIVARKGHPLSHARSISELLDSEWILTPDDGLTRGQKHYLFRDLDLPMPKSTIWSRTTAVALPMLFAGDAFATMSVPMLELATVRDLVDVVNVGEQLPVFTYGLISRSDVPQSTVAIHLARLLRLHAPKWNFSRA